MGINGNIKIVQAVDSLIVGIIFILPVRFP